LYKYFSPQIEIFYPTEKKLTFGIKNKKGCFLTYLYTKLKSFFLFLLDAENLSEFV